MNRVLNWHKEYEEDNYLNHISSKKLNERAKNLIENLTVLEENGKIGLMNITKNPGDRLLRLFVHVQHELDNRNEKFADGFMKNASIVKPMVDKSDRISSINDYWKQKQPLLIKYGNKKYLEKFNLKISLATSFNDTSLHVAQRDDEMRAKFNPPVNTLKFTDMNNNEIKGIENCEFTFECLEDYYVFCSSYFHGSRLFGDFEADCCLFIYDIKEFTEILKKAINKQIEIEKYGHSLIKYLDPIRPYSNQRPNVLFHKDFKYFYQNEYRHVFIPKNKSNLKKDIFVELPELSNCAELITL